MGARVTKAAIKTRHLQADGGLDYGEVTFDSIDDLFELCLNTVNPTTADRLVLQGIDSEGRPRTVTLKLQSVTNPDNKNLV